MRLHKVRQRTAARIKSQINRIRLSFRAVDVNRPMGTNMKLPSSDYRFVETEDGTKTLFSERFGEACHSTTGAKSETLLHYIHGCEITEKAKQNSLSILEVGFGLGVGLLGLLHAGDRHLMPVRRGGLVAGVEEADIAQQTGEGLQVLQPAGRQPSRGLVAPRGQGRLQGEREAEEKDSNPFPHY